MPPVAMPPRWPYLSTRTVLAPLRAAVTAAPNPAGPPPTTTTAGSLKTSMCLAGSRIVLPASIRVFLPPQPAHRGLLTADCRERLLRLGEVALGPAPAGGSRRRGAPLWGAS